jgi:cobalt-zinc-cadmium efflux system membrane fusion protein
MPLRAEGCKDMIVKALYFLAVLCPSAALADHDTLQAALGGDTNGKVDHDHGDEVVKLTKEQILLSGIAVAPAGGGTLIRRLSVPGTITLDAARVVRAPARVAGTVSEMRKRLGDPVEKGEIVAIIDSREVADAKADFLTASISYDLKKTFYERAKALWRQKISAEWQYLQTEADFKNAELKLDVARQKLSALDLDAAEVARVTREDAAKAGPSRLRQYPVRSPIAGHVIERKVDVGTAVGDQGQPDDLYTIADVTKLWIELAVPTVDLELVREGQKIEIGKDAAGRSSPPGRIIFVSPMLDPATRSARVVAEVDNEAGSWRPGSYVATAVVLGEEDLELRLPRSALQTIEGETVVFVLTDDGFERRDVRVGRHDGEAVEILSGVVPGEAVAVKNTFLLKAELGKSEAGHSHAH